MTRDTPTGSACSTSAAPPSVAAGAVLLGCAVTLIVHGYQFGQSNHSVYLIDALRKADPALLANDWFYTQTLQYHSAFGWLSAALIEVGALRAGFLAIYAAMVLTMHVSWRSIVRAIGGDERAYLLAVVLYYLSAGGIGLGTYQFLQDSAVLASNVANVAMLAGVAALIGARWLPAGLAMGVAALFHLNHAVVCALIWTAFSAHVNRMDSRAWLARGYLAGSALAVAGCLANVIPAAMAKLGHAQHLPLNEFVDLYVMLRHPHHYAPLALPWPIWLAFTFWIPWSVAAWWSWPTDASTAAPRRRATFLLACFVGLIAVSVVFAGVWYVSETLVQLSLLRFSPFAHLLMVSFSAVMLARVRALVWALPACIAVAVTVMLVSPYQELIRARLSSAGAMVAMCAAPATLPWLTRRRLLFPAGVLVIAGVLALWPFVTGLTRPTITPDRDYLALCAWARDPANTSTDAVFLVPPYEEDFRWHARRAIVVNWKSVPQLSGELPEWRDRLSAVLGWANLDPLPRGAYLATVAAMRERYDRVPTDALLSAAKRYGARYLLATRDLGPAFRQRRAGPAFGRFLLYDLSR